MRTRINLLPYREAKRRAARRQFGLAAAATAGMALALVIAVHGVTAGYVLSQKSRNDVITAENKVLDQKIEEIVRLRGEIDALKARKDVIESLQADRSAAVDILAQMVRLAPEGVYLRAIKQSGVMVTVTGYAQSNVLVADFMLGIGSSPYLKNPQLVEIKAVQVGSRRLSEFILTYELLRAKTSAAEVPSKSGKPAVGAKK